MKPENIDYTDYRYMIDISSHEDPTWKEEGVSIHSKVCGSILWSFWGYEDDIDKHVNRVGVVSRWVIKEYMKKGIIYCKSNLIDDTTPFYLTDLGKAVLTQIWGEFGSQIKNKAKYNNTSDNNNGDGEENQIETSITESINIIETHITKSIDN